MKVEEDPRRDDDFLLETLLEESESVVERLGERFEIQPNLSESSVDLFSEGGRVGGKRLT